MRKRARRLPEPDAAVFPPPADEILDGGGTLDERGVVQSIFPDEDEITNEVRAIHLVVDET
jgi:hypothetical protein